MTLDDLAAEIATNPDDDAPRLAWADAVGGERGELVVVQCDLARGGLAFDEIVARRRRERELLDRFGRAWTPPMIDRAEFVRGFPRTMLVSGRWASELPSDATDVVLAGEIEPRIVQRAVERMTRPRSIDFLFPRATNFATMLRAPKFRDLEGLGVSWLLEPSAVELLGHHHPALAKLWIHVEALAGTFAAIAKHLPHVTTLHLEPTTNRLDDVFDLPLVELALPIATTDILERLADRRAGQTIERLIIGLDEQPALWPLDHLPRLRALTLELDERSSHWPLLELELRALRELVVRFERDRFSMFEPERLAWRWGQQLELLAVRADDRRLAPRVAGELVSSEELFDLHRPRELPRGALVDVTSVPPQTHPLAGDVVELHELALAYRGGRYQLKTTRAIRVNEVEIAPRRPIELCDRDEILLDTTLLVYRRTATDAATTEHAARAADPWTGLRRVAHAATTTPSTIAISNLDAIRAAHGAQLAMRVLRLVARALEERGATLGWIADGVFAIDRPELAPDELELACDATRVIVRFEV